jgi:hypothetical protein
VDQHRLDGHVDLRLVPFPKSGAISYFDVDRILLWAVPTPEAVLEAATRDPVQLRALVLYSLVEKAVAHGAEPFLVGAPRSVSPRLPANCACLREFDV